MLRKFSLLLLLLLAACAAIPPATQLSSLPPGKALVHIYRRAIPLGPVSLSVFDGGNAIGNLPEGSYLDYYADPGPNVFKAVAPGADNIPYATSLVAGQAYYLMVYFLGDQAKGNAAITQVDEATAAKQMMDLKPAGP